MYTGAGADGEVEVRGRNVFMIQLWQAARRASTQERRRGILISLLSARENAAKHQAGTIRPFSMGGVELLFCCLSKGREFSDRDGVVLLFAL